MQINVDLQQCVSYELSNWYTVCFSFPYMLLSSLNEHYSFIYKKCSFKLCYKQEMVRLLWRFILLFFFCTCNITLYHNLDLEYACIFKKKKFVYRKQSTGKFYIQIVQSFPCLWRGNQSLTCCLVYQYKPVHYFQIQETGQVQALNGTPVSTRKMEVSSFFFSREERICFKSITWYKLFI